jgi:hypothetical protein
MALWLCVCAAAQDSRYPATAEIADLSGPIMRSNFFGDVPTSASSSPNPGRELDLRLPALDELTVLPPIDPLIPTLPEQQFEIRPRTVDWTRLSTQSFFFLSIQHSARLVQKKTRRELSGKFFGEWANAVDGLGGWGDGDSILTNYVGHPMMGAISGWIFIQNDPSGIGREFEAGDLNYWNSRLKAMGWAAFYSTQFELGPVSEATIGHVGKKRGTAGAVDLVMTPVGGMGWIVAEDATDLWVKKIEAGHSAGFKRAVRIVFNPNRSVANVLRLKVPWHRDTRTMSWDK